MTKLPYVRWVHHLRLIITGAIKGIDREPHRITEVDRVIQRKLVQIRPVYVSEGIRCQEPPQFRVKVPVSGIAARGESHLSEQVW